MVTPTLPFSDRLDRNNLKEKQWMLQQKSKHICQPYLSRVEDRRIYWTSHKSINSNLFKKSKKYLHMLPMTVLWRDMMFANYPSY